MDISRVNSVIPTLLRKALPCMGRTSAPTGAVPDAAVGATAEDRNKFVFFKGNSLLYPFVYVQDLLRASAELLGRGTLGTTYKAFLENGTIITVKRLKHAARRLDRDDVDQQISNFAQLRHEHLVPPVAYCHLSAQEMLLLYEYMPNGSLSALLHGNKSEAKRTPLNWGTRVKIALGAALGIDYLHCHGFSHGNIKSSNILLTSNYDSCVSDYDVAQLVSLTHVANKILGYPAPEVTNIRTATQKADVYSFGVLLLELLTGKAPLPEASTTNDEPINLPRWIQSVVGEEWSTKLFDIELMGYQDSEDEMLEMLKIALTCVAPYPDQRPTMKHVAQMLEDLDRTNINETSKLLASSNGKSEAVE